MFGARRLNPASALRAAAVCLAAPFLVLAACSGGAQAPDDAPAAQPPAPAAAATEAPAGAPAEKSDIAAWGEDHAGKTPPEYITGDECLFCHRLDIGPTWPKNPHGRTIRFAEKGEGAIAELEKSEALRSFAEETEYTLGRESLVRFLKAGEGYGKAALATVAVKPGAGGGAGEVVHAEGAAWDQTKFAESCAGCHATAVETETAAFAAISLDCYACHGSVSLQHTTDTKFMLLSRKRNDPPRLIASICGQCHLREGKSRSTGRPYPNQFVAGDNLFKDYEADFSDAFIAKLDPGEKHIYLNARDMAANAGAAGVTCLDCHDVHQANSEKHQIVRESKYCFTCHVAGEPISAKVAPYEKHSRICEY